MDTSRSATRVRIVQLGRRLSRRAVIYPALLLTGAALLYLPFRTQLDLDRWAGDLREHGRPAQAVVYDRETKSGNRSGPSTTMFLRYDLDGVRHEQEVGCMEVCLPVGSTSAIWVSRDDPGDFVTDFGKLSGHRGRFQGVLGAAGFLILAPTLFALFMEVRSCLKLWADRRSRPRGGRPTRVSMPRSKHKLTRGG